MKEETTDSPLSGRLLALGALLLVAAGAVMRLYALGAHPYGLYYDEAYYGLDALRVLAGARPLYFPENNGREPLFIYLMAVTIRLFGRDALGVRAAAAVCGLLTLPAVYLLGCAWANRRVGLLSAAILAVTLWHVHLSRVGFRVVALPLFIALALGLGALALRTRSRGMLIAAGTVYGLTFYTYLAARFTPLALLAMAAYALLWHRQWLRARWGDLAWMAGAALLVVLPLALFALQHPEIVFARTGQVAIWDPSIHRGDPVGTLFGSVGRTLGMFTWRGDWIWRHNVPRRPVFDSILSIAFLAGVGMALAGWRRRPAWALALIWVAVMSVPTTLAEDAPHFLRAVGVLPVVVLLPALAIDEGLRWWERRAAGTRDGNPGGETLLPAASGLATIATLAVVLLLGASAALTARDYFGPSTAARLRLSGFDYAGCYRTDPVRGYFFQAQATELARAVNGAEGTVYLDRRYWDVFPSIRFLVPESERLVLYDGGRALPPGRPPFSLFAWTLDGLPPVLRVLPPAARITVTPGPETRADEEPETYRMYTRWTVAPLAPAPGELMRSLARFDGGPALLGVQTLRAGDRLTLGLRWTRDGATVARPRLLCQVLDANDRVLAQLEETPGTADYPPALWTSGSVIVQHTALALPPCESAGLRLKLALYDPAARAFFAIRGANGTVRDGALHVPL